MPARSFLRGRSALITLAALWLCASGGKAQEILKELEQSDHDAGTHSGHDHAHGAAPSSKKTSKEDKGHAGHQHAASKQKKKDGNHQHAMSGDKGKHAGSHDASSHTGPGTHGDQHQMHGFLGPYPIQREGSGTSWLPDATPHFGVHATYCDWQTMYHAMFNLVYDHQGSPRGGDKTFVN